MPAARVRAETAAINRYNLAINHRRVGDLRLLPGHARKVARSHVERVARSIQEFGWINPIIIDDLGNVIAGAARLKAAELLKLETVPVIAAAGMSEAEKRAYRIAENRLAESGGWDLAALALEFENLLASPIDPVITGFDTAEIDALFRISPAEDEPGEFGTDASEKAISKHGDVWHIGEHRLVCGSALEAISYEAALEGRLAHLALTDPPYNIQMASGARHTVSLRWLLAK